MVSPQIVFNTYPPHHAKLKVLFKTQHGRIPIDPAILAAIGHCFIAPKKRKFKMPMRESEATRTETKTGNRRLFLPLKQSILLLVNVFFAILVEACAILRDILFFHWNIAILLEKVNTNAVK